MQKILQTVVLLICQVFGLTLLALPAAHAGSYRFVSLENPPYEYTENGVIKGLAVEIVKETFKLMNHEVQIEIYPWARSIEMFKNGEVDAIFTFFKTPERETFTFYSNEIILSQKISLWVKKDSEIVFDGDLSKLFGQRIGVLRKVSYGDKFDAAVKNGNIKVSESYTTGDCINLLKNQRVDIWVSNYLGAVFELKKMGLDRDVKELLPEIQEIPTYIGFSRKNNLEGLRDDFDKAFLELKNSGKYREIFEKYGN